MPNQMHEKVLAALSGLIPAEAHAKVAAAINEAIDAAVATSLALDTIAKATAQPQQPQPPGRTVKGCSGVDQRDGTTGRTVTGTNP